MSTCGTMAVVFMVSLDRLALVAAKGLMFRCLRSMLSHPICIKIDQLFLYPLSSL